MPSQWSPRRRHRARPRAEFVADQFNVEEIVVRVAVMSAPGEVRVEQRPEPQILAPSDAIMRVPASCICGSTCGPIGGKRLDGPRPMGHEYVGIVEEVGDEVTTIMPGQFVVGSFFASDNTCEICGPATSPPAS